MVITMKAIRYILMTALFAVCISLIVVFQRHIGAVYAGIMLLGIGGLLFLLWVYNRKYR
ncbi:MAG: hypothetical protein HFE66_06890 [Clostridiales bacterium]|nr:hypothetical protein [Clostridiales bacterium]